jgi:hypothetical protein
MKRMETNNPFQDVLLVCRNGHVITDRLSTYPDRGPAHCDRCGADTLDRCPTCGRGLPGALHVSGLVPVGRPRLPGHCAACGAPFPWAEQKVEPELRALEVLEKLLRRLPLMIRQLRTRHGARPPFRVEDERDLEDLLRAVLPLHFDDVRPEGRTPAYAPSTRTDFLLPSEGAAVIAKRALVGLGESQMAGHLQEDVDYYAKRGKCGTLLCLVYDPERLLVDPARLETAWSGPQDGLEVRCVIGS